jgi:hypothetical protein
VGRGRASIVAVRVLAGLGLTVLFVLGAVLGLVLGVVVIFWVSLVRGARAVHAEGVVCTAELIARDGVVGPVLAGPALARLSGAFEDQATTGTDVLGLELRLQRAASEDPRDGDQDVVFGTFESFRTAARDRAATDAGDYLANRYSSVTPWWTPSLGPVTLRLAPPPAGARDRGGDRLARLDADLAADRARLVLTAGATEVAELRLIARLDRDATALRVSMFRCGRGLRPLGLRNGVRATVYPISQLARRIRGG